MIHIGLNPSFADWWSRLPLFSNFLRRGPKFELFDNNGTPTNVDAPLGQDGLPINDGHRHGLRVFGDMDGTMPFFEIQPASCTGLIVKKNDNICFVSWTGGTGLPTCVPHAGPWHQPSIDALAALRPTVLRTLDLSRANEPFDWSKRRVRRIDPLQAQKGRGMAIEFQAALANKLGCHLWWNAPPRYSLSVADYEVSLEEMLTAIKEEARLPPILEYGNELWNTGFPVHGWLKTAAGSTTTWHTAAAFEIDILSRVAKRVFGPQQVLGKNTYFLAVCGQLTVPFHLEKLLDAVKGLGVDVDCAGPALYVTPTKADKDNWERTGHIPTQDELRVSMNNRLAEIDSPGGVLSQHRAICSRYSVTYFTAYEGGQSLIAGAYPWRKAALEAQSTDWMGDLYRRIFSVAEDARINLLCWYSAMTNQAPTDIRMDVFGLLGSTDLTKMPPKALAARGD